MSKDCSNHTRRKIHRRIFACVVGFVILVLFVILVIWLVLRPTKPKFYLQDATVQSFNLSQTPSALSSILQVTISSGNPNDRIGIFYDRLDVFAVYKNQQITIPVGIQPLYQGHNDVDVWSPYLYGTAISIAPYLAAALAQDEGAGFLVLHVRIDGRLRWKVGSWTSGHYHVDVDCPAFLSFSGGKGAGLAPSIKFQQLATCNVDV